MGVLFFFYASFTLFTCLQSGMYRNCYLILIRLYPFVNRAKEIFLFLVRILLLFTGAMQAADPLATQAIRCYAAPVCG